jgi:hypothetical protein
MFFINLFYTTEETYKLLIKKLHNDIKLEINNFNKKYPIFSDYIIGDDYDNLDEKVKEEWNNYKETINKLEKNLINDLLNYCNSYPNNKISKNNFINEYKKYPYRLEQNLDKVLLEL